MSDDTTKDPNTAPATAPTTPAPPDSSPTPDALSASAPPAEPAEPEKPKGPYAEHMAHWDKTLSGGVTKANELIHIALRSLKGQKRSPLHASVEVMQWLDHHNVIASSIVAPVADQCEELAAELEERGDEAHAESIRAIPTLFDQWLRASYGGNMPAKPRKKASPAKAVEG